MMIDTVIKDPSFAVYYSDFGKEFKVFKKLGKNTPSIPVETITNASPGIATLKMTVPYRGTTAPKPNPAFPVQIKVTKKPEMTKPVEERVINVKGM